MSPLARSLLALACAALLHASSAVVEERIKAVLPNWNANWPCAILDMGIENDKYSKKIALKPFHVPPFQLINIPNVTQSDEALVGQHVLVCDQSGQTNVVILKPVTPNKHSPLRVGCTLGTCTEGFIVWADEYVIKKLA